MEPSLTTDIWAAAYVRRCSVEGAAAFIVRKGDARAGAVLVRVNGLDGSSSLYARARRADGQLVWMSVLGPAPRPDAECEAYLVRAAARDPDLWVIEVEDKARRHFLDAPVD
ncbi:MAG: DUF1491 family protein [Alphaproteobacteria bacterium]|nr:DUF1491 family protein [Alphaproteobacteria bacterium]